MGAAALQQYQHPSLDTPPPEEIVPGLFRLHTPMLSMGLPWVMPYAFLGADGVTLFDAGHGTGRAERTLAAQLEAIGRRPGDIQRLIVSHAHADHVGMAAWVKQQSPGAELVMTRQETAFYGEHPHWLGDMFTWGISHGFAEQEIEESRPPGWVGRGKPPLVFEGHRNPWAVQYVEPDVLLEDGDELIFDRWTLRAVLTPGHTIGHLCMYEPHHRLTLTGDHVLSRITPNVSLSEEDQHLGRDPLAEFLASLKKVEALDSALGLPAHQDLIPRLADRCRQIAVHHDHRIEEVFEALQRDALMALEVAAAVAWNRPYETFSMDKKRSALGETLAHLYYLEQLGRIRRFVDDEGRVRWERV